LTAADLDIILASGPPFSAFSLAQRLAKRFGRPYVLDYRDLWSQNLHGPMPMAIQREASTLAGSAAVTVVSRSWASLLDREFGIGSKLHVISNGYDAEDLANVEAQMFDHFAIVYAGVFYPPKRVVAPLMAALRRLKEIRGDDPWMFHYFGRDGRYVLEEATRSALTERVVVHGHVTRSEALRAVKGAGVAVVITSVEETGTLVDNGMVTGKIFEAVGLETPTLLIAPRGSDANLVAEATGLARGFTANDVDGVVRFLSALIDGRRVTPKEPRSYSWGRLAQELDSVLAGVVSNVDAGMRSGRPHQ
jgi:glycosyltransferase involved in cell wall biosynthesis